MKVLFLLHSTMQGGATISFMNMVEGIIPTGVEPVIVHPKNDNEIFQAFLDKHNIKSYVVDLQMSVYPTLSKNVKLYWIRWIKSFVAYWIKEFLATKKLDKIVRIEKPAIIHTNTGVVRTGIKVALNNNTPHILHLREYQDKDFGWSILPNKDAFKRLLRKTYVISITKDIISYFDIDDYPKAKCIYNGCMSKESVRFNWPKQKYFLCANRISPEKGMEDLLTGFASFYKKHNDYRLLICGSGDPEYIESLKCLSAEFGCGGAIEWKGFIKDVSELMANCTALVVASYSEGFGRMTAESCLQGSVVIGRNSGGTKEILEKTGGYLFETLEQLTNQMCVVSELTENEYSEVALKAQSIAMEQYSIESNVMNIKKFYDEVLKDN